MTTSTATKKAAAKPAAKTAGDRVEHENMAAALAAFQAEMPTVHKGQTARIPGKDGRSGYSYKYADLADVAKAAHPVLSRHGLSFTARPMHVDGVGFVLAGVLRHESGEVDEGMLPIVGRDAQAIGSSLTYSRRYLLGCMTGIVTDEDEDGASAAQARTERPQSDYRGDPETFAQQPAAARQQGRTAATPQTGPSGEAERPGQVDAGDLPVEPTDVVVRAWFARADKAAASGSLEDLRTVWDDALAEGVTASTLRTEQGVRSLADHITAHRNALQAAAAQGGAA